MDTGSSHLQTTAGGNEAPMKVTSLLLPLMTAAAGAIVILALQPWVDFGFAETKGTDAEAATGISDGWFVAGLAAFIVLLIGGVIFGPRLAPGLLPMIAVAAVGILAIAGFDTVTSWQASGFHPENPGILVQAEGDPTIAPYAIAGLAVAIAISAAVVRAIQLRQNPHLLGDLVAEEDVSDSAEALEGD
jgi:hypothetical protein